ncbi:hypothetical protein BCR44DRAFT_1100172 [Catenaria anguillulae PL171]|uniref:Uncharacterized protein n=1 Tax=Catenaria anguillulae PL171 TaxID=765915 RepID=A0A1Y2I491_9FUNG|nr:hypothetical protein BCR44DRAFT_1100172 [Catenaria anguillulae PL171]
MERVGTLGFSFSICHLGDHVCHFGAPASMYSIQDIDYLVVRASVEPAHDSTATSRKSVRIIIT